MQSSEDIGPVMDYSGTHTQGQMAAQELMKEKADKARQQAHERLAIKAKKASDLDICNLTATAKSLEVILLVYLLTHEQASCHVAIADVPTQQASNGEKLICTSRYNELCPLASRSVQQCGQKLG